jgi:5-methyltetrahydrofolate--homocysteine methyltransferase
LINASRKDVREKIGTKNIDAVAGLASAQYQAGADYIDVNAGVFGDKEPEFLKWLVQTVQEAVDLPCCIDSPNPKAIEAALEVHSGPALINSVSLEKGRMEEVVPLLNRGESHHVVALCMSDEGMPETTEQRLAIADKLIGRLTENDITVDRIHVDPLVQPISTQGNFGIEFLNAVSAIMKNHEGIHTICGLSNISFGLPARRYLNRTFGIMAVANGLDGAIVDPTDKQLMGALITAETLAGKDDFCANYLKAYRNKLLS